MATAGAGRSRRKAAETAESELDTLKCVFRQTRYRGDKLFTIAQVQNADGGAMVTVKGRFVDPKPGDNLLLRGRWVEDEKYGRQFDVKSVESLIPSDSEGIVGFLDQLAQVGRNRGVQIVQMFGAENVWNILENEPEKLCAINGITRERALYIREQYMARKADRDVTVFLKQFGVTDHKAALIRQSFGANTEKILRENPYVLIEQVDGFGFITTDEIALSMGVAKDALGRRRALLSHVMAEAQQSGDVRLSRPDLLRRCLDLVGPECGSLDAAIDALCETGTFVDVGGFVYFTKMREHEESVATALIALVAA